MVCQDQYGHRDEGVPLRHLQRHLPLRGQPRDHGLGLLQHPEEDAEGAEGGKTEAEHFKTSMVKGLDLDGW